jgi:hypothetical protein
MGNVVLYSEHGLRPHLRICSLATWSEDYRAIVPEVCRPRDVQVAHGKPIKRKEVDYAHIAPVPRSRYGTASDEDITFGNPYRKKCPCRGFSRTVQANRVMSWMGVVGVRP